MRALFESRAAVLASEAETKRLEAEAEALRLKADSSDAARYRWLRNAWGFSILEQLFGVETGRHPSAELDAAIDSEIIASSPQRQEMRQP